MTIERVYNKHLAANHLIVKGETMDNFLIVLLITFSTGCLGVNSADAEYRSSNTLYDTLHIKQMAKRNFTNNDRTKYVYVEHKQSLFPGKALEIGAVQLEKNSKIRELYIAVDMKGNSRMQQLNKKRKTSIAPVSGAGHHLKNIHILVNSNGKLHY